MANCIIVAKFRGIKRGYMCVKIIIICSVVVWFLFYFYLKYMNFNQDVIRCIAKKAGITDEKYIKK